MTVEHQSTWRKRNNSVILSMPEKTSTKDAGGSPKIKRITRCKCNRKNVVCNIHLTTDATCNNLDASGDNLVKLEKKYGTEVVKDIIDNLGWEYDSSGGSIDRNIVKAETESSEDDDMDIDVVGVDTNVGLLDSSREIRQTDNSVHKGRTLFTGSENKIIAAAEPPTSINSMFISLETQIQFANLLLMFSNAATTSMTPPVQEQQQAHQLPPILQQHEQPVHHRRHRLKQCQEYNKDGAIGSTVTQDDNNLEQAQYVMRSNTHSFKSPLDSSSIPSDHNFYTSVDDLNNSTHRKATIVCSTDAGISTSPMSSIRSTLSGGVVDGSNNVIDLLGVKSSNLGEGEKGRFVSSRSTTSIHPFGRKTASSTVTFPSTAVATSPVVYENAAVISSGYSQVNVPEKPNAENRCFSELSYSSSSMCRYAQMLREENNIRSPKNSAGNKYTHHISLHERTSRCDSNDTVWRREAEPQKSEMLTGTSLATTSGVPSLSTKLSEADVFHSEKKSLNEDLEDKIKIVKDNGWYITCMQDLSMQDNDGDTIFHIAIAQEDSRVIQLTGMVDSDILNLKNKLGQVPLHVACYVHNFEVITALLQAGADAKLVDGNGNTVFHIACEEQSKTMLDCFADHFKQSDHEIMDLMNTFNNNGLAPIHIATQKNNIHIANHLMDLGCNINAQEEKTGMTPLIFAIINKDNALVDNIIAHGADLNIPTFCGFYPLNFAAQASDIELVKDLIYRNAELGSRLPEFPTDHPMYIEMKRIFERELRKRRRKKEKTK